MVYLLGLGLFSWVVLRFPWLGLFPHGTCMMPHSECLCTLNPGVGVLVFLFSFGFTGRARFVVWLHFAFFCPSLLFDGTLLTFVLLLNPSCLVVSSWCISIFSDYTLSFLGLLSLLQL